MEKRNILVTGGAGYIGSMLINDLLEAGHYVTVIDNFMFNQSSLNQYCSHKNFEVEKGDIRIHGTLAKHLKTAEIVIPLAALVGTPLCDADPVNAHTTNKISPLAMLKELSQEQIVIMPTTNSFYGTSRIGNFGICNEETPTNPISSYAKDKLDVENKLKEHSNFISYRLATVFGMSPRMRTDLLVNDFVYRAVKDSAVVLFESSFKRNYIHVRDVCRAFLHAINNYDSMKNQVYNVGLSDANLSKKELTDKIKEHLPEFVVVEKSFKKDKDQRNYIVSNKKLESTGFEPLYSLDFGIQELVKGYEMISNNKYGNI